VIAFDFSKFEAIRTVALKLVHFSAPRRHMYCQGGQRVPHFTLWNVHALSDHASHCLQESLKWYWIVHYSQGLSPSPSPQFASSQHKKWRFKKYNQHCQLSKTSRSSKPNQADRPKLAIQGNASAGTVDDIVLDEHGNVDYLIVATADGQLVTVPWDAAVYNADKRVATVQITPDNFKQVPTYTAQQYPVYSTPTYRNQVYQAYGLTPGQARRAVRRTLP
jgi:hypothetical protein